MEKSAFDSHVVWKTLGLSLEHITMVDALGDEAVSDGLNEIRALLAFSESFSEIDQLALLSPATMDALNKGWNQINQGLAQYLQSPPNYLQHLEAAKGAPLDSVRTALRQFPKPEEAGARKATATRAASAFIKQMGEARAELSQQIAQLRKDRDEDARAHAKQVEDLTALVAAAQSEVDKLTKRIGDDEARLSTALTETSDTFIKAQADRQERFGKWLEQQEEAFSELAKPHVEAVIQADLDAEEALKQVQSLRTSVVDMANLASGDILGDQYKRSALWDRVAGYIGYALGILAGVAGVWVVLFAFGDARSGLDWPQVVLKLGLTAAIGGVATVAFRFGGQSLARATAFKRQELELRALTPFLQDVDGSDAAKLAFVKTAFGRAWTPEQKADSPADAATDATLLKLLQTSVEVLNKAVK